MNSQGRNAQRTLRLGGMLHPPLSLPYRALAVTCRVCGTLQTTPDHLLRRDSGRRPGCRICKRRRERARGARLRSENRGVPSVDAHRSIQIQRAYAGRLNRRIQQEVKDGAMKSGDEWTTAEMEVVARPDLTVREAALLLRRTYYATRAMRDKIKRDPRKARLADLGTHTAELAKPGVINIKAARA